MKPKFGSVYIAQGQLDAQMIKLCLESFGIEAFIVQESAGTTLGLTLGPLGKAEVFVKNEDISSAKEIISSINNDKY